jgi:group I intron endonuclease
VIGIYKIQSIIKPERCYIGSSIDIINRWNHHLSALNRNGHKSKQLQRHYNKYGKNDLVFSVIILCEIESLIVTEQYYLDEFKPYFNTLIIANSWLGHKHTKESKKKISDWNIKNNHRPPGYHKGRKKGTKNKNKIRLCQQ